ncbi:hypothetical protein ACFPVT_05650 [Corynebacterium choanae]|uniref:Or membrane protein n=1 Tax=Corynebacterium choanae TaxID=1862358 RepID=A0A3G6J6V5_9CORY|nr:hypothetical protein [Corynebacterium choanae]AZA13552.1 hypothetical protein CCHOA_05760 [Corynebacterium choanae]
MNFSRRLPRYLVTAATAASLVFGAVAPATADTAEKNPGLSAEVPVTVVTKDENGKPKQEELTLPGYTQLSDRVGSSELQDWYNASPSWAQTLLGVLAVLAALDIVGTLLGPVRSMIFNVIRDANIPLPVPPRP